MSGSIEIPEPLVFAPAVPRPAGVKETTTRVGFSLALANRLAPASLSRINHRGDLIEHDLAGFHYRWPSE